MTKNYVDKEAQKKAQEEFTKYQALYNQTGDISILWNNLEPLFRNAAGPNILKINKFHYVKNFDEKVDNAVLLIMERYAKNPKYNFESLVTLMYWAAVSVCHNKNVVAEEMTSFYSYEDMLEKGMHDEHILSTEFGDIGNNLKDLLDKDEIGEKEDDSGCGENRPQTRVCYCKTYKRRKDGKRTVVHSPIGTGKTVGGCRRKCVLRTGSESKEG